jgi:5'-3' exoribonuclease 1
MGVPKFYRWLSERYPLLNHTCGAGTVPIIDNLYLDMNGVIHNCSHGAGTDINTRMTEDEMMAKVFAYLDHIFRMVRPRRLLYMAIDGVAPRAKMNQQRSRRFRSALEAKKAKEEAIAKGEPEPSGEPFDSNCITPGTPFMARLSEHLRFYVMKKQTEDPQWQKATVILSGHEVRGEGEHKIMEHIRWARGEPGWDPNQTHCLYGLDADLIMLALVTHEPHFCLLREVVKFGGGERGQPSREVMQNPTDDGFLLLQIGLLREYLDLEFRVVAPALPFEYDCERIVDDFVLLAMLVGNDFLPPLPTLDIAEGALNKLFATYRDLLPSLGGYVTGDDGGGTFDPKRLEKILRVMGEMEQDVLEARAKDVELAEQKKAKQDGRRGGNGGDRTGGVSKKSNAAMKSEIDEEDKFARAMAALMKDGEGSGSGSGGGAPLEPEPENGGGVSAEPTMMSVAKRNALEEGGIERWKEIYYREKLELKVGEPAPLKELRQAYFEGLNWVLRYYYRGVASWTWYYPFHYAPMASDLSSGLGQLTASFDYGIPFRPFEQLLAVQPPASATLLPEPFRWLMTAPHSPLAPFFPRELKVDFEGKRNDWEGVVLLPFLDEDLLKQCINSVPASKLTDAQIARNKPGSLVVFRHNPNGKTDVASTLPKTFGGLFPCKSRAFESTPPGEFPDDRACFGGVESLLPGVNLGADRPPGFPTVHSLTDVRGELKCAGVNVFGSATKKESLIVRVGKRGDPALLAGGDNGGAQTGGSGAGAYAHLLHSRVHVGWPYLREAMVVAVSDAREKITGARGVRTPHGASEWNAETQRTANEMLTTRGLDVGRVDVTLHCRACEGLVRHPDGSLQKRFGKTDARVPVNVVLLADPSPSPRLAERPALTGDAAKDAKAAVSGFSVGDATLYLGRSHFGAVATIAAIDEAKGLEVTIEPSAACTGVGRRILQGVFGGRYENPGAVARKLGLNPRALSQLTGPLWIAPTKDCGRFDRVDVGLNLKSGNKGLCVSDYTRPQKEGNGWEYSQHAIKLMQEYKAKHGWVFNAIMADPDNGFEGLLLDDALKHVAEPSRLGMLKDLKAWLKATPAARKPLVSKFSKVAAEEAIRALYAATGAREVAGGRPPPIALESVSPLALMQPVRAGEILDLYAGGDFDLGDRVAMVGDSGAPPFGTRGFVVATHGEAAEVMFDARDFVGATDLHGVLPEKRGAMLPVAQLVNLSHPPAMPQLGDAAPATRARDKKGKVTKGGWDGKDGKGGGKGVLAMAAALLPGRAPAVGGPGAGGLLQGTAAAGPKMPDGGRGFAGAGRGRGAAANGTGGAARTLGKPLPGAIVGSVVASNKPAAAAAAAAAAAPDLGSMLAGAQLKSILGVGRGAEARDESQSRGGGGTRANGAALSLEDLERRFADSTSVAPSPKPRGGANAPATPPIKGPAPPGPPPGADDPAAFWTALAGGRPGRRRAPKPTAADRPTPAKVTMPPRARTEARDAPTSLADLEAKIKPAAGAAAPAGGGGGVTLADLEARVRAPVEASAGSDDPLAFWAELQARHKSELDAIVGFAPDGNGPGPGPGPGEKKKSRSRGGKNR